MPAIDDQKLLNRLTQPMEGILDKNDPYFKAKIGGFGKAKKLDDSIIKTIARISANAGITRDSFGIKIVSGVNSGNDATYFVIDKDFKTVGANWFVEFELRVPTTRPGSTQLFGIGVRDGKDFTKIANPPYEIDNPSKDNDTAFGFVVTTDPSGPVLDRVNILRHINLTPNALESSILIDDLFSIIKNDFVRIRIERNSTPEYVLTIDTDSRFDFSSVGQSSPIANSCAIGGADADVIDPTEEFIYIGPLETKDTVEIFVKNFNLNGEIVGARSSEKILKDGDDVFFKSKAVPFFPGDVEGFSGAFFNELKEVAEYVTTSEDSFDLNNATGDFLLEWIEATGVNVKPGDEEQDTINIIKALINPGSGTTQDIEDQVSILTGLVAQIIQAPEDMAVGNFSIGNIPFDGDVGEIITGNPPLLDGQPFNFRPALGAPNGGAFILFILTPIGQPIDLIAVQQLIDLVTPPGVDFDYIQIFEF